MSFYVTRPTLQPTIQPYCLSEITKRGVFNFTKTEVRYCLLIIAPTFSLAISEVNSQSQQAFLAPTLQSCIFCKETWTIKVCDILAAVMSQGSDSCAVAVVVYMAM